MPEAKARTARVHSNFIPYVSELGDFGGQESLQPRRQRKMMSAIWSQRPEVYAQASRCGVTRDAKILLPVEGDQTRRRVAVRQRRTYRQHAFAQCDVAGQWDIGRERIIQLP